MSLDAQERIDADATALVERNPELAEGGFAFTPAVHTSVCVAIRSPFESTASLAVERLERRRDVDLHPAPRELPRRVVTQPRRDLGQDLRRRVDEHPTLSRLAEARVVAQRVATRSESSASASTPA